MHDCLDLGAGQVGLTQARKGTGVVVNPCCPALQRLHLRPSAFCAAQANFVQPWQGREMRAAMRNVERRAGSVAVVGMGTNWAEGRLACEKAAFIGECAQSGS